MTSVVAISAVRLKRRRAAGSGRSTGRGSSAAALDAVGDRQDRARPAAGLSVPDSSASASTVDTAVSCSCTSPRTKRSAPHSRRRSRMSPASDALRSAVPKRSSMLGQWLVMRAYAMIAVSLPSRRSEKASLPCACGSPNTERRSSCSWYASPGGVPIWVSCSSASALAPARTAASAAAARKNRSRSWTRSWRGWSAGRA